jgi:hypothetical protein
LLGAGCVKGGGTCPDALLIMKEREATAASLLRFA